MRLERLETRVYRVPTRREIGNAIHLLTAFEFIIVRAISGEGVEGIGWTYTLGTGGPALKALIDRSLAPLVVGEDPERVEHLWERMWRGVHSLGSAGFTTHAIAAVDIALWDLRGKAHGLPLYRLLGGARERVPVYASGVDLNYSLEDLVAEVKEFVARGFRAVKVKVGKEDPREDLERLRAVREAVGPHTLLMVDANQKWTVAEAMHRARMLEEVGVYWLEEPVIADDHEGYEALARSIRVPLAAGETHYTRFQFLDLFRRGAIKFVQADVCRVGGITEWLRIARLAEAFHLPMAPHFVEEISVHLCCGVANGFIVEHLPVANLNDAGVVRDPLRPVDGHYIPPQRPGHGVLLDFEALARYEALWGERGEEGGHRLDLGPQGR